MGLRELDIKIDYRSESENELVEEFYIPVLSKAVIYKRAVGFFSSKILLQVSQGISELIKNDGKMQIVASPKLNEDDIQAIITGYELRENIIERALLRKFEEPKNHFEEERFNYIAHLIANNKLDIKIALMDGGKTNGIYHEKIGIIEDKNGDKIAFTGSLNETENAVQRNFESIDVYRSWVGGTDAQRVINKCSDFENLWENKTNRLTVYDFPKAVKNKILSYKKDEIKNKESLFLKEREENYINDINRDYPKYPNWFKIRDYQKEAVCAWVDNKYQGLLNMATGTGKTLTALAAITELWKKLRSNLAIIIVCPYVHLVEQWKSDVIEFNMAPIIAHSMSHTKGWNKVLEKKIHRYNLGIINNLCIITTNSTYKTQRFQGLIKHIYKNVLLVIDEVHNAGAEGFIKYLNEKFEYRLALSATPERHLDDEGTSSIFNYFNKEVYKFSLEKAIEEDFLTPYYYYPEIICLTDDEYSDYLHISKQLHKYITKENGKLKLSDKAKFFLIERARIIAGAKNKLIALKDIMKDKTDTSYNLIYCGATYIEIEIEESEMRQIEAVTRILGNELNMKVAKFTAEESIEERENIIKDFSRGKDLRCIVAIKCLDEGVNIPAIQRAFILASSTNPREFIQRRGRVLRKFKGKNFAYIYDFIVVPRELDEVSLLNNDELNYDMSLIKRELRRAKEFASLALNKNSALNIINKILDKYEKYII
ncbi:DEAD/DEAH box helicase family protein [Clostridium cochlearium]|uniref:DEAD/DEAH box helicase family protein n=1 Tax=Clostridium cochlearium TaxID=1494 RepID=A0A7Y3V662_CLOCO|nr:DEAD/DEAH box helicase family protein [Clostridium cochlearium]NOH15414.1 DEAD/DEAH box helicase family protein [Clostridium cochlearium]